MDLAHGLHFWLGCGNLTVALSPDLPILLGHIPLLAVISFEGRLTMLLPSLPYPVCDWSSTVGQMLQDTDAWQLCWSREPTAFGYPGFMCPARGPFGETWKAGRWSGGPQVHIICLTVKCQQLFISIICSSWCCVLTLSCKWSWVGWYFSELASSYSIKKLLLRASKEIAYKEYGNITLDFLM